MKKENLYQERNIDYESSLALYNSMSNDFQVKQCYLNVYHVAVKVATSRHWKVAYGYAKILPDMQMFARHCFLINDANKVIDPTFFCGIKEKEDIRRTTYHTFKVFDNVVEYVKMVELENWKPDLCKGLAQEESKFRNEFANYRQMILVG